MLNPDDEKTLHDTFKGSFQTGPPPWPENIPQPSIVQQTADITKRAVHYAY